MVCPASSNISLKRKNSKSGNANVKNTSEGVRRYNVFW
jgi:hypothetical protein